MSNIRPFRGIRPARDKAALVASPPYDVLSSEEARTMAQNNPLSFLRVVKPEIDFDPGQDVYADAVYEKGKQNLSLLISSGTMVQDEMPCLYLYEQTMQIGERRHVQIGLVAGVSVEEYQKGLIKKHELTREVKEKDRTRHVATINANTGPVFLTYRADAKINEIVAQASSLDPIYDFVAQDGIGHRFWVIEDEDTIQAIVDSFSRIPHLYVADGHHRSASASNVCEQRKKANPNHTGQEEYNFFLSVIFPHDQMYIMDYNRVVMDLGGLSDEEFLQAVREKFELEKTSSPSPARSTEFGMYFRNEWYRLRAKAGSFDSDNPVESLDVAILQNNLLGPVLGIKDPRTDERIDFVGGIRGTTELERRVNQGGAVAFAMYATSIDQLMAIADANEIMPPKSTWFEPKLRSGLVVHSLD